MAYDVEAAGYDHLYRTVIEFIDHITYVSSEGFFHLAPETVRAAVNVYHASCFVGDEMNRPDSVVERKIPEVGMRRAPVRSEVVDFHRAVEIYLLTVNGPEPFDFRKIFRHEITSHIAGRINGHRRMRRKTIMPESGRHSSFSEIGHGEASVTELGVGVEIIPVSARNYRLEINHSEWQVR